MIRVLAQIIARQVLPRKEGLREEPVPLPSPDQPGERTPSLPRPRSGANIPAAGTEPLTPGRGSDSPTQALVDLFAELAQRRMQALHQQEEIHE